MDYGFEAERQKERFLKNFKPKPIRRTVWLNVYPEQSFSYPTKDMADVWARKDILYQQEVELIDPRKGEKK